jgi:LuxR family maltose regulon positive regulatory protein
VKAAKGTVLPPGQRARDRVLARREHPAPRVSRALVRRPRIDELLTAGAKALLTVIVAPAGSGKTTALAHWVAERDAPTYWVTATSKPAASLSQLQAALHAASELRAASDT